MGGTVFLAPGIMGLFFGNPSGEDNDEIKNITPDIQSRLSRLGVDGVDVLAVRDCLPVILSLSRPGGRRTLAITTGLLEEAGEDGAQLLLRREAFLLSRPDVGFFTAACFLPFVVGAASAWFVESSRQVHLGRRPGTSHLAGVILRKFQSLLLIPLAPIARIRHRKADQQATPSDNDRARLRDVIEKISGPMQLPVREGHPFRRRIYQAMGPFLPFSPSRWQDALIWKLFAGGGENPPSLMETALLLEEKNHYTACQARFRCHPSLPGRFGHISGEVKEKSRIHESLESLFRSSGEDLIINLAPTGFFILGVLLSAGARRLFGLPLILWGVALIIRRVHFRSSQAISGRKEKSPVNTFMEAEGTLAGYHVENRIDGDFMFVQSEDKVIPVILRQFTRTDEILQSMTGKKVKIQGNLRVEGIPYLDINTVTTGDKNGARTVRSAHGILQVLSGMGLVTAGVLMLLLELVSIG